MKSTYAKINPEDKGSSFSKKPKKPQPIAKTPMSARTSAIKVYILLGNRAKFDDKANDTKEMEKNKIMGETRSRLSRPKPMKSANEAIANPASVSVMLTE